MELPTCKQFCEDCRHMACELEIEVERLKKALTPWMEEAHQLRSALKKIIAQPLMVYTNIKIAKKALKGE